MRHLLRDASHLVRVAVVCAAGVLLFLGVRAVLVPESFGELGHYRATALAESASRPVAFAGREACAGCHDDIVQAKAAGRHARLGCEACHGPLAKHAGDPAAAKPVRPDSRALCIRCHEAGAARPKGFAQVNVRAHAGAEPCGSCHQAHSPGVDKESAK